MFPYLDHVHFEATCSCIRLVAAMVPCHAQALFLVQQPIMTLHAWFLISIHKVLCPCAKSSHCTRHCTLVPLSGGGDYIAPCAIQGHGLHATTCHVANDANKACPMCLAHVWGVTLKPLSVATPCHLTFLKSLKFPFLLKEHFKPFWRRQHLYLRRHNEF